MKITADVLADAAYPRVATHLLQGFSAYSRHYVRRHFQSIRILKNGLPPTDISSPVVIYLNHASWWDPLVCLHLARKYFAHRRSFAPIDEASLQRYAFFKQLGFLRHRAEIGARCNDVLADYQQAAWLRTQHGLADTTGTIHGCAPASAPASARHRFAGSAHGKCRVCAARDRIHALD